MSYEEWINSLEIINKSRRNTNHLEQLEKEDINPNIEKQLSERIENTIKDKLKSTVKRVKREISSMFKDENSLEFILSSFQKDLIYLKRLKKC